ncbi:MAG: endonuclease/exonuclease/phosphatase family protein [Candidatus Parcubacteria bacterium]|nr:endonuclease/exonuclease/phosphatase family protein [Candidatus Parcubacteria bacterium]
MKNSSSIHFVSVNIERDKHYDTVLSFLKEQNADVICLQEVFERDIPMFEKELGMKGFFAQMFQWPDSFDNPTEIISMGVAMFTKFPVEKTLLQYYKGDPKDIPVYVKHVEGGEDTVACVLLSFAVNVNGISYSFGTTHFTWTPHGNTDERQRKDLKNLLGKIKETKDGIIFAGDFNAPRGKEIFDTLSENFKDNIPVEYITSLDQKFHRNPEEVKNLMVDGLFSTPEYAVSDVFLQFGISDHAAIVANVLRIR